MNKKRSDKQKSCQAEVPLTMKDMLRVAIQSWVLITVLYFVVSYSVVKKYLLSILISVISFGIVFTVWNTKLFLNLLDCSTPH